MQNNKSIIDQTVVVILAAGKGARIGRSDFAKVCMEIDTIPAINRLIAAFKKQRLQKFLVVVGSRAEQVLDTIETDHPGGVTYVYQKDQLGTGHAARLAAQALQNLNHQGNILVTMGDKWVEQNAVNALIDGFIKQNADLALLTVPKKGSAASSGRVFTDNTGQALDIIEKMDIAKQTIADELTALLEKNKPVTGAALLSLIQHHIPTEKKQLLVVPDLIKLTTDKNIDPAAIRKILNNPQYHLQIEGRSYTAQQIESHCTTVNPSLYLFNADTFYHGIGMIDNNNAQKEYYITDVIKHLAAVKDDTGQHKYRLRTVPIDQPQWILGFNSPDELLAIQDYIRKQKTQKSSAKTLTPKPALSKKQYDTAKQWLARIESSGPAMTRWLKSTYGDHPDIHRKKIKQLISLLKCFTRQFSPDAKVCIVRAPNRLNIMGRHIDHHGGYNNFLAIDSETFAVAELREDDNVAAVNTQPKQFKPVNFSIADMISSFGWADWINFTHSERVRQQLYRSADDWGGFIKAAVLRLQHQFQDIKIKGINLAIAQDVPVGAGLNSSSTLVLASLHAAIALNNFELTSSQFIDLCGQGEWFAGSREQAAAHPAVYLGQRNKITQVGFFPFRTIKSVAAPKGVQFIIADSCEPSTNIQRTRNTLNTKQATLNLALALLKQRCPEIAYQIEYLRDLDPEKLGCSTSDIYRYLLKVPQTMTRKQLETILSNQYSDLLEQNFATHSDPGDYHLRDALLYGAAETCRAKIGIDLLETGQLDRFGRFMAASHDGDRVIRKDNGDKYKAITDQCDEDYMNRLIRDITSEDPQRVLDAQLYHQPGRYGCSTQRIDRMVDIANSLPGVIGSQIAGAGLGGCIMILAKREAVAEVKRALSKYYYTPNQLRPDIIPCTLAEDAGLVQF